MNTWRIVYSMAIIITTMSMLQIKNYVTDLNVEIRDINNELYASNDVLHVLEAEWSYLNNPIRLERLSEKYLDNKIISRNQVLEHSWNCSNNNSEINSYPSCIYSTAR